MSTDIPNDNDRDILEQNVETLLEKGGEAPHLSDMSRARMRAALVTKHAAVQKKRSPLLAIGGGLAAAAAAALIVTRVVGGGGDVPQVVKTGEQTQQLADGSTWITDAKATVTVLGERRVRVEGAALLDVAPGKEKFVVETARGTIVVHGTRFLVDATPQRTTTAVVRGVVELATDDGNVTLHAGEQAVAEPGRPPTRGPAPRLSHLASWAAEARRQLEHDITPLRNGTLFARDPGVRNGEATGPEYPLPMAKLGIDIVVEDQVARVALDQTFRNGTDRVLEGMYRFAIPPDAALQRLAMYVDGTLTESAVVERMRARRIYEELVYRRVDPALLEYAGTGRLALRVYPLPAKQDKRLMLAYTQSLPKLYEDWTVTVPLPELDAPVGEVELTATLRGCGNCEVTSPSHAIDVARSGNDARVSYRKLNDKIGDSLVLRVRDATKTITYTTDDAGDERFVMVRAKAELPVEARTYRPRTWVVLDDVSASRGAMERRAQADVIDALARELDEDDTMSVIAFDVSARTKLAPTRVRDVDRRALRAALAGEGDVGATNVQAALAAATTLLAGVAPDDAMIIYLGDGVITAGPRKLDELRAQIVGKAHFIGVGVGDGPDTQTLQALAAATGGYTATLDLADDLGWRTFDLVAALHTTRATGITARFVDEAGAPIAATTYLAPQIADGEELEIVAKLASAGTPAWLEVSGIVDGKPWQQRIPAKAAKASAGYLPRLWAQHHVAARMLAKHEPVVVPPCSTGPCPTEAEVREARDEAIRKEVVSLGKKYFLLSRHTSLLVLENDKMYAQYDVKKGSGETWAPYVLPPTIPVATVAVGPIVDATNDDELFRVPQEVFHNSGGNGSFDDSILRGDLQAASFGTIGMGRTHGTGMGFGVSGAGRGGGGSADERRTRSALQLGEASVTTVETKSGDADEADAEPPMASSTPMREMAKSAAPAGRRGPAQPSGNSQQWSLRQDLAFSGSSSLENRFVVDGIVSSGHRGGGETRGGLFAWGSTLQLRRLGFAGDAAYDDLSSFVPALFPDASDAWRARLAALSSSKATTIDPAARTLLAAARAALPAGVYRWGGREIAVDAQRRLGWRATTVNGLGETMSFDGSQFVRRYAELGLDVARSVTADSVALTFAYLPLLIAEPAHYARWFTVGIGKPNEVTLSSAVDGKPVVMFVLVFDDAKKLVEIRSGQGSIIASALSLRATYSPETVADATQWAHGGTQTQDVVVELPMRAAPFVQKAIASMVKGSPAWRTAQRQLMASYAANGDTTLVRAAFDELRQNGGVQVGDLVLASSGLAAAGRAGLAESVEPLASTPIANYLLAGRSARERQTGVGRSPETTTGFIGALWQLRDVVIAMRDSQNYGSGSAKEDAKIAEKIIAIGAHAPQLRVVAAALTTNRYHFPAGDIVRVWNQAAVGQWVNVARANSSVALANRGLHEQAAEQVALTIDHLDLSAPPPDFSSAMYGVANSRRGRAGWQMLWARWRDKVLASESFPHVMSLARANEPQDLPTIFARAAELAGNDVDLQVIVAQAALQYGQTTFAQTLVDRAVKAHPTRELHQLAALFSLQQQRPAEALTHLEAAQKAGRDEAVSIAVVRTELGQIVRVASQVAVQASGADRERAVARAMEWGSRWRAIDPGHPEIDTLLGELQLAVGNREEAWRQLSTVIERDPMAGKGYMTVAEAFERRGKVAEAIDYWHQAMILEQTNPTPRLRKAQALIALGRAAEGDALLDQIIKTRWHDMWSGVAWQAQSLRAQGKGPTR